MGRPAENALAFAMGRYDRKLSMIGIAIKNGRSDGSEVSSKALSRLVLACPPTRAKPLTLPLLPNKPLPPMNRLHFASALCLVLLSGVASLRAEAPDDSVLFQRSTWQVSPAPLPLQRCVRRGNTSS